MRQIRAIAANTFRESIRQKVLYNLLAFAVLMIGLSVALGELSIDEQQRISIDIGLASLSIFGGMLAIFIGIGLVYHEIQKRTVYTVLAKPIHRWQFVLGKYLGLLGVLLANLSVMSGFLIAVLWLLQADLSPAFFWAILLVFAEFVLITAFALCFSTFTSPSLSAIFALSFFSLGHLSHNLRFLAETQRSPLSKHLLMAMYHLFPNLDYFDLKTEAVHALTVNNAAILYGIAYSLAYTAALLTLSVLIFSRRNLK